MIAAALSVRSLLHLQGIDTGFSTEHVQTMRVDLNFSEVPGPADRSPGSGGRSSDDLTRIDGVVTAGGAGTVPLDGRQLGLVALIPSNRRASEAANERRVGGAGVARQPAGGVARLLRGARPAAAGRPHLRIGRPARRALVVVVNESLARRRWPGASAIGQRLRFDRVQPTTVVGVVEDTRQRLDRPAGRGNLFPAAAGAVSCRRTGWCGPACRRPISKERSRAWCAAIDPEQPVDNFRSLESFRADRCCRRGSPRRGQPVLAAGAGDHGDGHRRVIGYAVQQRRHEFGVRLALGAVRLASSGMVLGDGLSPGRARPGSPDAARRWCCCR